METFSALLAICAVNSPVSGEFPAQRPVTRGFDVFFDFPPPPPPRKKKKKKKNTPQVAPLTDSIHSTV